MTKKNHLPSLVLRTYLAWSIGYFALQLGSTWLSMQRVFFFASIFFILIYLSFSASALSATMSANAEWLPPTPNEFSAGSKTTSINREELLQLYLGYETLYQVYPPNISAMRFAHGASKWLDMDEESAELEKKISEADPISLCTAKTVDNKLDLNCPTLQ